MSLIVFDGKQRSPCVIVIDIRQAAALADDLDYIALNVLDVVIHDIVSRERNRAVVAVIVEVQRIITLYHRNQIVIGVIVIMSSTFLCTQAVDIVLDINIIAILSDGFEPAAVFLCKRQAVAILERTTHSVIIYRLSVL
jgi:hypothetical protein